MRFGAPMALSIPIIRVRSMMSTNRAVIRLERAIMSTMANTKTSWCQTMLTTRRWPDGEIPGTYLEIVGDQGVPIALSVLRCSGVLVDYIGADTVVIPSV